jgi:hypothetical protein
MAFLATFLLLFARVFLYGNCASRSPGCAYLVMLFYLIILGKLRFDFLAGKARD